MATLLILIIFVTVATLLARRGLPAGKPRSPIEPLRVRRALERPGGQARVAERSGPGRGAGRLAPGEADGGGVPAAEHMSEEAALELLMQEFADGRLTLEEYERRLDELYRRK